MLHRKKNMYWGLHMCDVQLPHSGNTRSSLLPMSFCTTVLAICVSFMAAQYTNLQDEVAHLKHLLNLPFALEIIFLIPGQSGPHEMTLFLSRSHQACMLPGVNSRRRWNDSSTGPRDRNTVGWQIGLQLSDEPLLQWSFVFVVVYTAFFFWLLPCFVLYLLLSCIVSFFPFHEL